MTYCKGKVAFLRYNISDGVFACEPIMNLIIDQSINSSDYICFNCTECHASLLNRTPLRKMASLKTSPVCNLLFPISTQSEMARPVLQNFQINFSFSLLTMQGFVALDPEKLFA